MNNPATLARAQEQITRIETATSHGGAEILYDVARGWLGALEAEQLIGAPQHAELMSTLAAALRRSDERLKAAEAASRAPHQQAADIELQSVLKRS